MAYMAGRFSVKPSDRATLEAWVRARTISQEMALRAQILLASAEGEGPRPLARRLRISPNTVCVWRRRYAREGLDGLRSRAKPGRPRRISEARERAVVAATLRPPKSATHWSAARLGREMKVSHSTVHRIWQKYGLQPHRVETFKFSRDPEFDAKMADVVGLYLDPPERALVLCVDEKSQIQANRTQPILPLRPGLPARMTHDYQRHGTTSLFAALDVASGKVHGRCFSRHTHEEFLAFLESVAKRYPRRREIHLICDNYGTHKHPAVKAWLAEHPRFHMHFTPTSASWLNLVERWFAIITQQAIRRGSFDSVRRLERAITKFVAHWNEDARPFRWTKSPREIRRKIRRVTDSLEIRH